MREAISNGKGVYILKARLTLKTGVKAKLRGLVRGYSMVGRCSQWNRMEHCLVMFSSSRFRHAWYTFYEFLRTLPRFLGTFCVPKLEYSKDST